MPQQPLADTEFIVVGGALVSTTTKLAGYEQIVVEDSDANNGIIRTESETVKKALIDITERLKLLSDGLVGIKYVEANEKISVNDFTETTEAAARFEVFNSTFTIPNNDRELVLSIQDRQIETTDNKLTRIVKIRTTGNAIRALSARTANTLLSTASDDKISGGKNPTMHVVRTSDNKLLWALTDIADTDNYYGHVAREPEYVLQIDYGEIDDVEGQPDLGFSPPRQPPQGRGSIQPPSQPDPQPDEDDDQMHGP